MAAEEVEPLSDDEIPENVHNRLLGAISNLYKQKRVKAPVRKESSSKVSEFHLTSIKPENKKSGKIDLSELTSVLEKRAGHTKINEQIRSAKKKTRKLPKPLEKPQAEKLERSVGYENLKKDLNKWDPIVYHQRVAEHVSFPLKEPKMLVHKDPNDFLTTFKTPTELELQLAESLSSSELLKKDKEEEELDNFKLSLAEIKERRSIMARLRAQLSYKEAKAARQNRIKSKKFHRILRKDKIKNQIKEFEELQKTDPEAALKKLDQLEKARAQERASLRHRTTGQWARNLAVRAKYNKEARVALSEQLAKSRELTQKLKTDSASEDENVSEDDEKETLNDTSNSWLKKVPENEVQQFYAKYKEYENEKEKEIEHNDFKVTHIPNNNGSFDVANSSNHVNASHSKLNKFSTENKVDRLENRSVNSQDLKTDKVNYYTCNETNSVDIGKLNNINGRNSTIEIQFSVLKKFPMTFILNGGKSSNKDGGSSKKSVKRKLPIKSGSWSVTEIKQDSFNSKDQNFSKNKTKRKLKMSASSSDVEIKSNMKRKDIDDVFFDVEERLTDEVQKKIKKIKRMIEIENIEDQSNVILDDGDEKDDRSYLEMKKRRIQTEIDEELVETPSAYANDETKNKFELNSSVKSILKNDDLISSKKSGNIIPNNFLCAKPKQLNTELPSSLASAEDNLDDLDNGGKANDNSMTISEAFACDDVDEEFRHEKEEEVKKSQIEDVNLVLPGWGSWGGPNIQVSKRKSKKLIVKFPKQMPRKDENKGNVVINEDKDEKIKPHLVNEMPFPFTSVKEYEASIRAPLGRTWLPQSAHLKLIEPAVTTKLGAVIEPMTKDQIVKNKREWK